MNLVVGDAELKGVLGQTTSAMEEIDLLGTRFVALLNKMKAMGYVSEAMDVALSERAQTVTSALEVFKQGKDPMSNAVSSLISTIDGIDRLF